MKKSLYFFALLGLLFVLPACQKEVVVEDNGLTSPSGFRLADNYDELATMIETGFKDKYNLKLDTEVKNVRWENHDGIETGFVDYLNAKGEVVSFAVQPRAQVEAKKGPVSEANSKVIDITVWCTQSTCTGNCNMDIVIGRDVIVFTCWCDAAGGCGIGAIIEVTP